MRMQTTHAKYRTLFFLKMRRNVAKFATCCSGDHVSFANSLDPDQDRQNVGPDLDQIIKTV